MPHSWLRRCHNRKDRPLHTLVPLPLSPPYTRPTPLSLLKFFIYRQVADKLNKINKNIKCVNFEEKTVRRSFVSLSILPVARRDLARYTRTQESHDLLCCNKFTTSSINHQSADHHAACNCRLIAVEICRSTTTLT